MGDGEHADRGDHVVDPRMRYANERTFLAWIRTSLALMTAGLAITQLLPEFKVAGGRRIVGLPLIALAIWVALSALRNWDANERAMRAGQPLPRSLLPRILTGGVGLIAVAALVLVVVESAIR
jgi:inner membrane protein YidH